MGEAFLQHARDLVVAQPIGRLDHDGRFDPGGLLARRDRQQAVGVHLEGDLDARSSRDHRRDAAQLEARERAAIRHQLALALHHVHGHRGLTVLEGRELLRARGRDRAVARDDSLYQSAHRLESERQRNHVEQQQLIGTGVAGQRVGLDRRAQRDDLVGIQIRQRRLAEELTDRRLHHRHARRPTDHHDALDR